jgi:hypothetical protein
MLMRIIATPQSASSRPSRIDEPWRLGSRCGGYRSTGIGLTSSGLDVPPGRLSLRSARWFTVRLPVRLSERIKSDA